MKLTQLNHVALLVDDVPRSVDFYTRVLRLEPIARPAFDFPGAWFRLGVDQELHLIGGVGPQPQAATRPNKSNHYALMVDDMEAWEGHLRALQVPYAPRKTRPDGAWQIYVRDPDGHAIELCTPPGMAPREPG